MPRAGLGPLLTMLVGALLPASCASGPAAVGAARVTVPDLIGADADAIGEQSAQAGVKPILRYRWDSTAAPRTVIAVAPAPGTTVERGTSITIEVAGAPGASLDERITADREHFVGLGTDPDGTLVIAVAAGADRAAAVAALGPTLLNRRFRTVVCPVTHADLERIRAEVSATASLHATGYTVDLEATACAVRLTGDIAPPVVAALRQRYGGTLIVSGGPGPTPHT
ncbi:PASTA domain-containing protein [Actinoplanes flavus]|uniref:PASTA domain-containing protein n=1 Tax=Actinoplanes flavus TaxID=2820290 RepID=A0ABS3UR60_9ACTN|nr:PASTA domain-containing protein [Actinoplanes flavus]MBO3741260.1 PASTA domain-containing protein [Actinoplanes flavus]